ncbi:MAG: hypothetical protein K2L46_02775 [Paramuribaculum sp.]|nr:hypothetical protein [Paramuribaculum sp.]MDE6323095.1 hypothetical protein [Paramuribaculum sp.]MDE6488181.1 hypothetical protein [Paramuribaculum sp.]
MKKLLIALFAAAALLPLGVSCDSGANEPDSPIESGNPADSIPADTLPSDTIPTDTVPPVTPPDQKPQGLDSVLIPEGLELVDYTPYTGPVEPLSENFRPIYVDGRRWSRVRVADDQTRNDYYNEDVAGEVDLDVAVAKRLRRQYSYYTDTDYKVSYFKEENGAVLEAYPGELYYFNGELKCNWDFLLAYDVFPSESIEFTSTIVTIPGEVISRGTITLRGRKLRAAKVLLSSWLLKDRLRYDYWVEGIGSLFGFIIDNDPIFTNFKYGGFDLLIQCVDENGQLIYDYRDFDPDLYEELEILSDADQQP